MQARGFSLVELVVVIGMISILLAIGVLNFPQYLRRYRGESQTRTLYQELLKARAMAVYQRRGTLVKLFPGHFEVYSSQAPGAGPAYTHPLGFQITCNATVGNATDGYEISFDNRGLCTPSCSICLVNENPSAVDSIVISYSRLEVGKKEQGSGCKSDNIKTR